MPEAATSDGMPSALRGCTHCGLVQTLPETAALRTPHVVRCARCGGVLLHHPASQRNHLSAAFAAAGLLVYPLGIGLPVLRLERFGHVNEASIGSATVSLLQHGQWVIGAIVLLCSVVVPIVKLVGLLVLTLRPDVLERRARARLHRWIDLAGRWGMIDVLAVAVLVAALKLGDLVAVEPGPGVVAFGSCVVASLVASAFFDPHSLWETPPR